MKAPRTTVIAVSLLAALLQPTARQSHAASPAPRFVQDELLVKIRPGADHEHVRNALASEGATVAGEIPQLNIRRIKVPAHLRDRIRNNLGSNHLFTFAEPDFIAEPLTIPNDPSYTLEWHLPKIAAPAGWDLVTGTYSIDIAIADTGVDPDHPDLAGKLLPGYNFFDNNSDTRDVYGHGTAVAGTAAASGNNGLGVTGVAWNNAIMPLRISDAAGYGYYSTMANAIVYAADHGVRIVNMSFGGTSSSTVLQSAIDYAWSRGTIVFASAGNSNTSTLTYPAACTRAVAVAATDPNDSKASFSNYGTWITLTAPGTGIYTTSDGGGYVSVSGTSFSSPITAGVAALILSVNPLLSAQQVVDILKQSADDLGSAGFDPYYGYGRVNVAKAVAAAQTALTPADTLPPVIGITSPADGATVKGIVTVNVAASDTSGVAKTDLYVDGVLFASDTVAPYSFIWDSTKVTDGTHTIEAFAADSAGNTASSGDYSVTVQNSADVTLPVAAITSPVSGSLITALKSITVAASATDNRGVARLELYIDGILKYSVKAGSLLWKWDLRKVTSGSHTILVKAFDTSGNMGTATSTVKR